jgi:hypothetical protein
MSEYRDTESDGAGVEWSAKCVREEQWRSSLITSDLKNTTDRDLINHCLMYQEDLGSKSPRMTDVVSELVNFVKPL